jgi:lipoprotein NlpD
LPGRVAWRWPLVGLLALLLSACGTARWGAPTEGDGRTISGPSYTVRAGDTLIAIGWQAGVDYRKIAEWNRLRSPDRIYVGQVLRLTPPDGGSIPAAAASAPSATAPAAVQSESSRPSRTPVRRSAVDSSAGDSRLRWQWPTEGRVIQGFAASDPNRKGVKIGGKPGQPILAAESGQVVYSGSGLVGYGPLIIIKHNNSFLSAYGHNRKLLVAQGEQVTKGTRIAEMGLAAGEPLLHFEIRRDGDPVDPMALLPRR